MPESVRRSEIRQVARYVSRYDARIVERVLRTAGSGICGRPLISRRLQFGSHRIRP
jgi:hypothetical protein